MVRLGIHAQTQTRLEKNFVAAAEIFQVDRGYRSIRDRDQGALIRADARRAQADVFNCPGAIAETADISHAKNLVAQNGDTAKQVLDGFLRAEPNRETPDPEASKCGAHVEAQVAQHC